ncbi:MAG: CarD family transcriptional regulator [Caldimicrobium sp.]|nr:CarD family transcriptional regulator [Caldimicrobium sp.]MCX7874063.1 CarD family transcriptional regulator [Caldimicrobium sp.]MDW8093887.1 CarD family transcriptional regulator [Caldimicrobium sp.]
MFKIGDVVVYPGCGLGKILDIKEKVIEGKPIKTYIFKLLDSETHFFIPLDSVQKVGLRPIISSNEAQKVYLILSEKEITLPNGNWNKRYREYTERLKSGDVCILARLLRELYEVSKRKPLSYGEKKIFERAKELLVKELAFCERCSEEEIEKKLFLLMED